MQRSRIAKLNLEHGYPTAAAAAARMTNALLTYKHRGYKAVILIHGYGSTGVGGGIKKTVNESLKAPGMRGVVRAFAGGERWFERKRELLNLCGALSGFERCIAHNEGVTVVILR